MPQQTEAQLIAGGYVRVAGDGERVQVWTLTGAGVPSRTIVWDSLTTHQMKVEQAWKSALRDMSIAGVVDSFMLALTAASFTGGAAARTSLRQQLLEGLKPD